MRSFVQSLQWHMPGFYAPAVPALYFLGVGLGGAFEGRPPPGTP